MDGSNNALATRVPGRGSRIPVWPLVIPAEPRGDRRPIDLDDAPWDHAVLARAMAEARSALHEAVFAAATAAVRARTVAEALDEALEVLAGADMAGVAVGTPARDARFETVALSPREREVLALVAEGRSNKVIAEALFVSPNTIKTHVASLLHKFDADSRAQLAAMVAGQAFR